jgi:hypothetical protein
MAGFKTTAVRDKCFDVKYHNIYAMEASIILIIFYPTKA